MIHMVFLYSVSCFFFTNTEIIIDGSMIGSKCIPGISAVAERLS